MCPKSSQQISKLGYEVETWSYALEWKMSVPLRAFYRRAKSLYTSRPVRYLLHCRVRHNWMCFYSIIIFEKTKLFSHLHFWQLFSPDAKGQLISKGLFVFFNSPKKWTKNFGPSRLGQKLTFSSSFFGRIEDTKISFRD